MYTVKEIPYLVMFENILPSCLSHHPSMARKPPPSTDAHAHYIQYHIKELCFPVRDINQSNILCCTTTILDYLYSSIRVDS